MPKQPQNDNAGRHEQWRPPAYHALRDAGRVISFHAEHARRFGVGAAILLQQAIRWSAESGERDDGWFQKRDEEWARATMLSVRQVTRAYQDLCARGVLAMSPLATAETWFRVDFEQLDVILSGLDQQASRARAFSNTTSSTDQDVCTSKADLSSHREEHANTICEGVQLHEDSVENKNFQPRTDEKSANQALANAHYLLFEALCDANGSSAGEHPSPNKQLAVFSRMLDSYAYADILGTIQVLGADPWWLEHGFDAFNVEKKIDKYIMQGRPAPQQERAPGSAAFQDAGAVLASEQREREMEMQRAREILAAQRRNAAGGAA